MSPASEVNAADPRGLEKKLLVRGLTSFVDDVKVISGKQELIDASGMSGGGLSTRCMEAFTDFLNLFCVYH